MQLTVSVRAQGGKRFELLAWKSRSDSLALKTLLPLCAPTLQVAGLRLSFDPASRPADSRLVAAEILINGSAVPLDAYDGSLILLTNDYMSRGGDCELSCKGPGQHCRGPAAVPPPLAQHTLTKAGGRQ